MPILKGALTMVAPSARHVSRRAVGGGLSARYCYGVWLKQLTLSQQVMDRFPRTVVEIGPGDSLGTGLAALLSGVERYHALDLVPQALREASLGLLDELVGLYRARQARPAPGWPDIDPLLGPGLFPDRILGVDRLASSLAPARIQCIREALLDPAGFSRDGSIRLHHAAPWRPEDVDEGSVDLAFSHAVLQHVDDLDGLNEALWRWLRPGGSVAHQVDYGSHRLTRHWNGHRACPDWLWTLVRGRRDYLLNREPPSGHRVRLVRRGFTVVEDLRHASAEAGLPRGRLKVPWAQLPDDELACDRGFIQALKGAGAARPASRAAG